MKASKTLSAECGGVRMQGIANTIMIRTATLYHISRTLDDTGDVTVLPAKTRP